MKKERGITLVALIITIIVLLILAGVTIGQATSGTGIFGRAKNAVNTYRNSVENENTALIKVLRTLSRCVIELFVGLLNTSTSCDRSILS